ncbi:hypothetical protein FBZ93_12073 [Bradyrhizobium macuxiense]|uniref:Uncharacterized protein n=1 Tax=Bradyrhizobium macuxiense TaxID=1755647 RepID=A0A560KX28_9BRAD|nr:hypothetical protein FBZ93_12073 [Bradyrhizobium macuxiense]
MDEAIDHDPHHQRAKVPARAGQPSQHATVCGLVVQVRWLRIEFSGKGQNFVARYMVRTERSESTRSKIFERKGQRKASCKLNVSMVCGNLQFLVGPNSRIEAKGGWRTYSASC